MKNSLLLFVGAAALSLASCSQEKTADTTTTTTAAPADATAVAMPDTAAYRSRSKRVSEKFITDMKITDPAMQGKIRTAYYNRSKRYGEMKSKYASDTTGMAAAMRQYNTDTDTEFQGVITDPTQYQSYQSSRSNYDESNYMDDAAAAPMPADNSASASGASASDMASGTSGAAVKESKTKMENGAKIKLKDDGTVKTKGDLNDAEELKDSKTKLEDGTKIKIKGDGTVKVKDANGDKTKM
ncbi:MAG: hypothetical protein EOO57_18250 [Hymenobacter sp.]|nr:MAG: hypothetical protein EOO57_18250 [Hymenobacter sp.]